MSDHQITAGDLPDLEDLAAFAEQRLEGAARQAVMDRLAKDEDYYEVYVELLRFREEEAELLAELEREGGNTASVGERDSPDSMEQAKVVKPLDAAAPAKPAAGKVLRSNRWRRWMPVASLAAMLAVATGLWLVLGSSTSRELKGLASGLTPNDRDLGAGVGALYRGGSEGVMMLDPVEWFLLGAQIMNLELAQAQADEELVKRCRDQLDKTTSEDRMLDLTWQSKQPNVAEFVRLVERTYADSFYLRYGMWTRAVWLAGRAQNHEYLARRDVVDWLEDLQSQQPNEDTVTAADLDELASLLESGEYDDLVDKVEQIARGYDSDFQPPAAEESY